MPGVVKRAQSRFREGIPSRKVRISPKIAFEMIHYQKLGASGGESFAQLSANFARFTAKWVDRVEHDSMFAFCGAALEGLEREKRLGHTTVLDQYDTGPELEKTIENEALRFKKLNQQVSKLPASYYDRMREEWRLADRIHVNSSWTRESLLRSGIQFDKIAIVPLSYSKRLHKPEPRRHGGHNLRVLWFGRFCLGKGLAYAIEAARLACRLPIDFTFVGASLVDLNAVDWPGNCKVHPGLVHREEVDSIYARSDVFLFPTLSDNFGGVQLEAMANGLPVIATPCCGAVVEHGKSGFIVPPRDPQAIVEALEALLEPGRLESMSAAACARVDEFSTENIFPHFMRVFRMGLESTDIDM